MIQIDYTRDQLLTTFGKETLKDRYLVPGETSPQDAFARAALAFADDNNHAQRLYDYASKLWMMFSTPILSNGGTERGLPISCYLSLVGDSREAITDHWTENMFLASTGGGIGTSYSRLRSNGTSTSKGSRSNGIIPLLKVVDSEISAISQGNTRRGSYVAYLDVSHPEIEEFVIFRKPSGGDENRKCLNLHNAVNVPDEFMEAVRQGLGWNLIDPHTQAVVKTVSARELWQLILETRVSTGEPYIHFIDEANRHLNKDLKKGGFKINSSNLCQEIELPTSEDRTAVCCLSSVNIEKYDEWKDDDLFIGDMVRMLDNALSDFVKKAPSAMWRAVASANGERSIGLGAMGFHSYLQKMNIPFEGPLAVGINHKVFERIKSQALKASQELFERDGPPEDLSEEGGVRNAHLLAIAPNASSSIICGNVSPSIEPYKANAFTQKTLSGSSLLKNSYLEKLLEEKGRNDDETWQSIIVNSGSVQHLDFLSDWEKDVFKTAIEIDQHWIIQHAADRQQYICQGQSINLFIPANSHVKWLHELHIAAWVKKLKGLYYCRSESIQRPDLVSKQVERITSRVDYDECISCSG